MQQKGVDPHDYAIRQDVAYLDDLGYTELALKRDEEASATKPFNEVKRHRGERTNLYNSARAMAEQRPAFDSQSNGHIGGS